MHNLATKIQKKSLSRRAQFQNNTLEKSISHGHSRTLDLWRQTSYSGRLLSCRKWYKWGRIFLHKSKINILSTKHCKKMFLFLFSISVSLMSFLINIILSNMTSIPSTYKHTPSPHLLMIVIISKNLCFADKGFWISSPWNELFPKGQIYLT